VDRGDVPPHRFAAEVISSAVSGPIAAVLWNRPGQCRRLRVEPRHIAIVWLTLYEGHPRPPSTWKLSQWEIDRAKEHFPEARAFIERFHPNATAPAHQRRLGRDVVATGQ